VVTGRPGRRTGRGEVRSRQSIPEGRGSRTRSRRDRQRSSRRRCLWLPGQGLLRGQSQMREGRPGGRRIAGGKRPLTHFVDGRPRRRRVGGVGLGDRSFGQVRFGGSWLMHATESAPALRLPQWGRRSTKSKDGSGCASEGPYSALAHRLAFELLVRWSQRFIARHRSLEPVDLGWVREPDRMHPQADVTRRQRERA
jgi:hypothetical protein